MNPLLQSVQIALQNAEQKEAIAFIDKVVDFCIEMENGKVLDGATRDYIQTLVAYHIAKDTITSEIDASGNISGIFMWYNCNEDEVLSQFRRPHGLPSKTLMVMLLMQLNPLLP